jgi:hypothetical protein
VVLEGQYVFTFTDYDTPTCVQWKIPPLRPPKLKKYTGIRKGVFPVQTWNIASPGLPEHLSPHWDAEITPFSRWPRTRSRPFRVVLTTTRSIAEYHHVYYCRDFNEIFSLDVPDNPPLESHRFSIDGIHAPDIYKGYGYGRFCGDLFVHPWNSCVAQVNLTVVDSAGGQGVEDESCHKVVRLWEPSSHSRGRTIYDFCPLSARFCVEDEDGRNISVIDF